MLDLRAADGVAERTVRILYGEGDRYGCWLDVLVDNIVWHPISNPAEMAPGQPAPDAQQVRCYPQCAPADEPDAGGHAESSSAIGWLSQAPFPCTRPRSGMRWMRQEEWMLAWPEAADVECLCRM